MSGKAFSDHEARLYRDHGPALVRFATGLVGPHDAADVVQAAVLRAFTARSWATVSNHKAYLYRSVANEARSQYRSTMRRRARELRTAHAAVAHNPEIRPDVLEAVGALSPRQREVVYLTYWEDLDEAQVAERLGIGRGSVRKHLGRGREKLRELLDE
jgi:RNA polymerase sigma factor (sigma-70 family)